MSPSAQEKALSFIKNHKMAHLATIDGMSRPYVSSIYYVIDKELNFYFVTKSSSLKFQNLSRHGSVAMTITDQEHVSTLQMQGTAEQLANPQAHKAIIDELINLTSHADWPPPVLKIKGGHFVVVKFTPTMMRFGDFRLLYDGIDGDVLKDVTPA